MDILDLIKTDHQHLLSLFEQVKADSGRQLHKKIAKEILNDLDHAFYAKETVLYPAFRNFPDFQLLITDALSQHTEMKTLLKVLSGNAEPGDEFDNRLLELKSHVESHITHQEEDFFPLIRKEMKRPERERLGRHFQAVKNEHQQAA